MDQDEAASTNQGLRREAAGGGGGGSRRASAGQVDPRDLAPFLNALDQYNPTVGVVVVMVWWRGWVWVAGEEGRRRKPRAS